MYSSSKRGRLGYGSLLWCAILCALICLFALPILGPGSALAGDMHDVIRYDPAFSAPEKAWPDKELPRALVRYWQARMSADDDPQELFYLEAPYFQAIVSFGKYQNYIRLHKSKEQLDHLQVFAIEKMTDYLYVVRMKVHFQDAEGQVRSLSYRDNWVCVDGQWYHVIKNPVFFPKVSW